MTLLALLLTAGPARAFDSDTQPVQLADTAKIFSNAEYSTGFVPAGSPLQVGFSIEANGGADVSMEGDADLSWPDALLLKFTGRPGTGIFLLDASLDAVTDVAVDLSDYGYYGTFEIDRRTLSFSGTKFFDPFLLAKSDGTVDSVQVEDPGVANNLITYTYDIFVGLSLTFSADLSTDVTVGFSGAQIAANDGVCTVEDAVTPVTYEAVGDYPVDTTYTGAWDANLAVILTPSISACASVFGCVTVASFDIPFNVLTDSFLQDFPAIQPSFPLPLLTVGIDQADMGAVNVGQIADLDVPIGNDGSLSAYGTATIQGSSDFTVFPTTFDAMPGTEDGLVVTYAPTASGDVTADLVLMSNDPGQPEVHIPLTASGTVPDTGSDVGQDTGTVTAKTSSCGCSSVEGGGAWTAVALVGFAALILRRRSSSAPG